MQVSMLVAWLVAAMTAWVPLDRHGYYESREVTERRYSELAAQIASVALDEEPLFAGEGGRERGALLVASIGSFESEYNARIIEGRSLVPGDNDDGVAVGAFQTQVYGKTPEGWTRADLAEDPRRQAVVAFRMVRESLRVCRFRPLADGLGHYAEGGDRCGKTTQGLAKSANRVNRALRWWKDHAFVVPTEKDLY